MMCIVRAVAVHTPQNGMAARTATQTTGSCGAGMFPSRMQEGVPPTGWWGGALVVMVSKAMAVGALSG